MVPLRGTDLDMHCAWREIEPRCSSFLGSVERASVAVFCFDIRLFSMSRSLCDEQCVQFLNDDILDSYRQTVNNQGTDLRAMKKCMSWKVKTRCKSPNVISCQLSGACVHGGRSRRQTDLHYLSPSSSNNLPLHHHLIFSPNLKRSPANMIDPVQAFAMATGTLQEAAAKASVSASMFASMTTTALKLYTD